MGEQKAHGTKNKINVRGKKRREVKDMRSQARALHEPYSEQPENSFQSVSKIAKERASIMNSPAGRTLVGAAALAYLASATPNAANAESFFENLSKDFNKVVETVEDAIDDVTKDKEDVEEVENKATDLKDDLTGSGDDTSRYDVPWIKEIQTHLATLGYDPGPVDGVYGAGTKNAVKAYQSHNGLIVNGAPTASLMASLREAHQQQVQSQAQSQDPTSKLPQVQSGTSKVMSGVASTSAKPAGSVGSHSETPDPEASTATPAAATVVGGSDTMNVHGLRIGMSREEVKSVMNASGWEADILPSTAAHFRKPVIVSGLNKANRVNIKYRQNVVNSVSFKDLTDTSSYESRKAKFITRYGQPTSCEDPGITSIAGAKATTVGNCNWTQGPQVLRLTFHANETRYLLQRNPNFSKTDGLTSNAAASAEKQASSVQEAEKNSDREPITKPEPFTSSILPFDPLAPEGISIGMSCKNVPTILKAKGYPGKLGGTRHNGDGSRSMFSAGGATAGCTEFVSEISLDLIEHGVSSNPQEFVSAISQRLGSQPFKCRKLDASIADRCKWALPGVTGEAVLLFTASRIRYFLSRKSAQ